MLTHRVRQTVIRQTAVRTTRASRRPLHTARAPHAARTIPRTHNYPTNEDDYVDSQHFDTVFHGLNDFYRQKGLKAAYLQNRFDVSSYRSCTFRHLIVVSSGRTDTRKL